MQIEKFRGPKASVAQKQLAEALCESAECIVRKSASSKVRKAAAVLSGTVEKKGKERVLELVLRGPEGDERLRKEVQLEAKGAFPDGALDSTVAQLLGHLAPAASASAAQPAPPPPVKLAVQAAAAVPVAAPGPAPAASPAVLREPAAASASAPRPVALAPSAAAPVEAQPRAVRAGSLEASAGSDEKRLAVTLAFEALRRDFAVQGLSRGAVADSHTIRYFPMPALHLAVHPWVDREGALQRLGFTGAFAYGAGVASKVFDHASGSYDPKTYSHSYLHGEGAADFVLPLNESLSFNVFGGLSFTQLRTGSETGSNHLASLPDVGFLGPKGGVGLSWQHGHLRLWGNASAVYAFSAGPIVSEEYFTDGTTTGLEGMVGAAVRLGPAELSARATYTRYAMSFKGSSTDAYQAEGASDQYLVGSAGLGFLF